MSLRGKKILIFQQRGWGRRIGQMLARRLHAEGARLGAVTFKNTLHQFMQKQREVPYELIVNNDEVMADPLQYLAGDDYPLAEICRELGVDSIWPLVMASRMHVRSYRDKYYYSFLQNASDEGIIDYVKAAFKQIKIIFQKFGPELIVAPNFADLFHLMMNLYAKRRGVRMLVATDCKVRGMVIFAYSYNEDEGPFYDRMDELNAARADTANRQKARDYIAAFRKRLIEPMYSQRAKAQPSFWKRVRMELAPYREVLRWYTKPHPKYSKAIGVSFDYRPPRLILRDHYTRKRYKKAAENFPYYPFAQVKKYVYFPLQFQPESTIDVVSPVHNNQIEIARQIALALPDDYTLVVKDHPVMLGYRSPSYLEKVARMPNVKLIDYRTDNEKLLQSAAMLVSVNSTALAEAAMYWKPGIQVGNLGTTMKLPNVIRHTDMTTLPQAVKARLALDLRTPEYERQLENYIAAVYDTGFELDYWGLWEQARGDGGEPLWLAWKKGMERALAP